MPQRARPRLAARRRRSPVPAALLRSGADLSADVLVLPTTVPQAAVSRPCTTRYPQSWPSPRRAYNPYRLPSRKVRDALEWRDIPLYITGDEGEIAVHWALKRMLGRTPPFKKAFLHSLASPYMANLWRGQRPSRRKYGMAAASLYPKNLGGRERMPGRENRLCHSTWLFCLGNMLKNICFFSNFPLAGSMTGGIFIGYPFGISRDKAFNRFLWHSLIFFGSVMVCGCSITTT